MVESERNVPAGKLGVEEIGTLELGDVEATRALDAAIDAEFDGDGFVGLIGPLGAGKTTLVKGMMASRGAGRAVARSPTYTLLNVYRTDPPVVHADLYRVEGVDDLESTGYWDYVRADRRDIIVEWFDRVIESWPGEGLIVALSHRQSGRRAVIWASSEFRTRARAILTAMDASELSQ